MPKSFRRCKLIRCLKRPHQVDATVLKIEDRLTDSLLDSMWSVNLVDYDTEWLQQNVESWIEWKTLEKS